MSIYGTIRNCLTFSRSKPRKIKAISVWHTRGRNGERVVVRFYDLNGKNQITTPAKFGLRGSNGYVLIQDGLGNWMRISFKVGDIQKYDPTVLPTRTFTSAD